MNSLAAITSGIEDDRSLSNILSTSRELQDRYEEAIVNERDNGTFNKSDLVVDNDNEWEESKEEILKVLEDDTEPIEKKIGKGNLDGMKNEEYAQLAEKYNALTKKWGFE